MATVNKTNSQTSQGWTDTDNIYCMRNRIDFTDVATGDVVQCLSIPAGTLVTNVMVKIITAETCGATTATVGDGAGANSWDASTNLAATAGTVTVGVGGTDTYVTTGKLYSTADTIDLTCTVASGPMDVGVADVMAICVKF
jgi:hypothetical protein